jgi:hypothetical protein
MASYHHDDGVRGKDSFMNVRWLSSNRVLMASLIAAVMAVVLLAVLVVRQHVDAGNGQLYLETAGGAGANPFMPLSPDSPQMVGREVHPEGASPSNSPGTDNIGTCDLGKLAAYLRVHPEKANAWAQALNSDPTLTWSGGDQVTLQQIPAYLSELTPRVLTDDLRVTNYQFTNGSATAVQAVLQNGTAVLVDAKGVSRVRCACGNPLTPMIRLSTQPKYLGTPWPGFQPPRITVIDRPPQLKDVPRSQPELQLEAEPQPKHDPRPRPEHRAEQEPQPGPMLEPKLTHEPKHESKPEVEPKPETNPKLEETPKPESKSESKPETKQKPETKPEPETKPKSEPKSETKPEPKLKPEPKSETKPKPEAKSKSEPKSETKPKPEPKLETNPSPSPKPKPEPKREPKAER